MPDVAATYENAQTITEFTIVRLAATAFSWYHATEYELLGVIARPEVIVRENRVDFKQTVERAMEDWGLLNGILIIDARETRYIDSTGMGILVTLNRKLREAGDLMVVVGLNDDLLQLFHLVRLDTVLELRTAAEWRAAVIEGRPL